MSTRIRADQLRIVCARRGVTFTELARLANVRRETISRALSGKPVATKTLQSIAVALQRLPELPHADLVDDRRPASAGTGGR
jgi:transcriptional regulator with XRE-family HTH domain